MRAPIGAVFRQADGWAVYAVEDGRAKLVPVTLGAKSDVDVEIAKGVAERDAVVVHPGEKVKEGALLTAR